MVFGMEDDLYIVGCINFANTIVKDLEKKYVSNFLEVYDFLLVNLFDSGFQRLVLKKKIVL
jgi:hypothetical protein